VAQERTTGSVRRSIEAVTEGLELLSPGLHLYPAASPSAYSKSRDFEGGARRQLLTDTGAVPTAAERLHGSSMTAEIRRGSDQE
jgi:hypothetical protein